MTEPKTPQKAPYTLEVTAGQSYAWCSCGYSDRQPLCDGSHKPHGMRPMIFTAEKTETVYLCGCKRTADQPYCDGTHNSL